VSETLTKSIEERIVKTGYCKKCKQPAEQTATRSYHVEKEFWKDCSALLPMHGTQSYSLDIPEDCFHGKNDKH